MICLLCSFLRRSTSSSLEEQLSGITTQAQIEIHATKLVDGASSANSATFVYRP